MNYKNHGAIAAVLILISLGVAGISIYQNGSVILLIIFLIINIIALAIILFSYCRKCYKKNGDCVHLNIGKLTLLMPESSSGNYTIIEILGTAIPVMIMVLFPQYWLFRTLQYFITYWVILALAITEIGIFVCAGCKNNYCTFCRNKKFLNDCSK